MNETIRRVTTPTGDSAWVVTNFDTVKALLSDSRLGCSHAEPERAARASRSPLYGGPVGHPATEAAEHARTRRLYAPGFTARRMARLQPRVTAIVDDLLDAMTGHAHPVDFHEAVSYPLPLLMICELLGVPYADQEVFRRCYDEATHLTDAARAQEGLTQLHVYMRALVERKQAQPGVDMISSLIAAAATDPDLTIDEITTLSAQLLWGGHETTVAAIDRGVILLLTHPEQADVLRHDSALIAPAVEEILRSSLPTPGSSVEQDRGLPRYANTDFTIDGVTIRTGELVMLGLRAANRDEKHFPEPEQFDVYREYRPHLAFGHGPRFCPGAPLVRIQLQTLLPALLSRFPTLRLAIPVESLQECDERVTRGLAELPVTW